VVFIDDSPFERNLVRHALPMVAVPEYLEDLSFLFPENETITDEDRKRTEYYQANEKRKGLSPDELHMVLTSKRFDREGLPRIHQLINKTNQFNLTTLRLAEEELRPLIGWPLALQFSLSDVFGDQGMIGVIIGDMDRDTVYVELWCMSCRVIGRGVEHKMFDALVQEARKIRRKRIIGEYRPTSRNGIVKDLYANLGFTSLGDNRWEYALVKEFA